MLELSDAREERVPFRIERPTRRQRPTMEAGVKETVQDVRLRGDIAVLEWTSRLDGVRLAPDRLRVEPEAIAAARSQTPSGLADAFDALAAGYRRSYQQSPLLGWLERGAGETAGELVRPLRRVGIHVPPDIPGRLSGLIGNIQAARVAGVDGIAVCSAPTGSGEIADPVLAACSICGVDEVYRVGGVPAVAAMAYGTETVRPVDKVIASGGPEVAYALRLVRGWVGTGTEPGPPELVIVADETSSPQTLAEDLAAHAARGAQGSHVLVTASPELLQAVVAALDMEVSAHDPSGDVENALVEGGRGILVRDLDQAFELANAFAPECLMLSIADAETTLPRVRNAGSVLLGDSPAAAAPIFGTGGLLPSSGRARWESAVSPRDFIKTIPVTGAEPSLPTEASHLRALAEAEGSETGALGVDLRRS